MKRYDMYNNDGVLVASVDLSDYEYYHPNHPFIEGHQGRDFCGKCAEEAYEVELSFGK